MIMRQAILSMLRAFKRDNSGNIAMIVAFGMPALIGAGGLSVDITQWYVWKRELQHSVDQAAIGGAWAMANANSAANYQTRALQEFNANQAITSGFSTTPTVKLAIYNGGTATNYLGGMENSVVVSATASKRLPFSGFLTGNSASVTVRSQASFAKGQKYKACLVATANNGIGLSVGGNADVNAQCGLAALSCDNGAIQIDGSATVATGSIATCGTASVPTANQAVVSEHVQGLTDGFAGLATPTGNGTDQTQKKQCQTTGTGNNKTTLATLNPGTYTGGIQVACTTVLNPGIYVIDGGTLDLSANYNVTGLNVMFVLKNGASIKFGGNGNNNKIILGPLGDAISGTNLATDPNKDIYENMLVFEDKNNNPGNPGHILNGNSLSLIEGTMYLPSGDMTVVGTANVSSQCLRITAYRIHVSGNASLTTMCDINDTQTVGTSTGTVRLVA